jgi:Zn-finger domain-containing protein
LDFAEVGGGKPNAANKDAIAKAAQLAEDHEEKHKAGYESAFKTFDPDKTAKELMAKTFKDEKEAKKELEAKFKALKDALMQACLDLHKSEGIIEVTTNINIQMKPAGASGCR